MYKKSFTLFEIIISIILISIIYLFAINSFNSTNQNNPSNITLINLKEKLLEYDFNDNITIKCIKDDLNCFVFLDEESIPQEKRIDNLFITEPVVYKYSRDLETIEFLDLDLEKLQRYEIFFEFTCKKNRQCDELIIEKNGEVLVFNNLYLRPIKLNYLSDFEDLIKNNIQEVKDAF
ncbi:MAG: hypothetical protein U9O56_08700 [Campylobacterota bacterium]|nr:hypothetical protein [Campylobacterota bacterium]